MSTVLTPQVADATNAESRAKANDAVDLLLVEMELDAGQLAEELGPRSSAMHSDVGHTDAHLDVPHLDQPQ